MWAQGPLRVRRALLKLAFPKGLTVAVQPDGSAKIRPPIMGSVFRLNREGQAAPSRVASPGGAAPLPVVWGTIAHVPLGLLTRTDRTDGRGLAVRA